MSAGRNTFGRVIVKGAAWLDPFAGFFAAIVGGVYKVPGGHGLKDLLHGTWPLRHPLHPAVTDLTIGGYSAVFALDVLGQLTGERGLWRAADYLLVLAVASSLVAIASGLTDWNDTVDDERRTGIFHGLLMMLVTVGFVASLVMRLAGGADARGPAIALSALCWVVLLVAGYFGGEMVFGFGTEVNRQAWTDLSDQWMQLDIQAEALADRALMVAKTNSGVDVLVTKLDASIYAIANTCTHAGGPLNEGTWVGPERCEIQCPWHASRFCVKDGGLHGGPATFAELAFDTRVSPAGMVEVRVRG